MCIDTEYLLYVYMATIKKYQINRGNREENMQRKYTLTQTHKTNNESMNENNNNKIFNKCTYIFQSAGTYTLYDIKLTHIIYIL